MSLSSLFVDQYMQILHLADQHVTIFFWWSAFENPQYDLNICLMITILHSLVCWLFCDIPLSPAQHVTVLCLSLLCLFQLCPLSISTLKCPHSCSSKWIRFRDITASKSPHFSESSNEAFNDECRVCWPTFTKCQDPCLQTWDPRDRFGGLLNNLSCLILQNSIACRGLLTHKVAINRPKKPCISVKIYNDLIYIMLLCW